MEILNKDGEDRPLKWLNTTRKQFHSRLGVGVDVGGCVWEGIGLKARLHRVGVCMCQRVDVGQWMCEG